MSDMPLQRQQSDLEDWAAAGPVSHDEARAILTRFANSHFKNPGERARISIPADPKRDDDIRMAAYIVQCRNLSTENAELRRRLGEAEKVCSSVEWSGRRYDVDGQTGYESSCPWCGGWELDQDDPKSGHAPDCALAKVIRDAGGWEVSTFSDIEPNDQWFHAGWASLVQVRKVAARATEDRLKEAEAELARRTKEAADARERVERE